MAHLRGRRFLTCFYCGKRSSTRYDGLIREFLCLHCDATNYLDERGEITDPPVAKTTSEPAPKTYAIPRSQSPDFPSPSQSIFCSTCLKNQHLFTSSLAQYLPEDTDHPDYAELEKNMYKFRRRLEQRYPQICAECEPKVHSKLDQAGYTARTDHLRRMMDRSRKNRVVPRKTTPLDVSATLGRWLWLGGIVCQYMWHLASLAAVFASQDDEPLRDPDATSTWVQRLSLALTLLLPKPERLIYWSLWANALSIWWNPKFAQVFRGFSRHILGLGQWYTFQGLIILTRFMAMNMTEMRGGRSGQGSAQMSLHGLMALLMMAIYVLAQRSVRIDTTPLFQTTGTPASSPPRPQAERKEDDTKNMSNLLDDILAESGHTPRIPPSPTSVGSNSPALFKRELQHRTSNRSFRVSTPEPQTQQPQVHYSEEMDWSPTQSKHRAFNDFGPPKAPNQVFGQPPQGPNASPFWYKVPPAPIAPAQRLRNGPKPLITKPVEKQSIFATSSMNASNAHAAADGDKEKLGDVAFAQPKFFAPSASNPSDPRSSLADLLNSSFSLSQDDPDEGDDNGGGFESRNMSAETANNGPSARTAGLRNNRLLDVFTLATLLAAWLHATSASYPYSRDVMLGAMVLSMAIAVHLTGDAIKDMRREVTPSWASIINTSLGIGELAVACHFALQIWDSRMPEATSCVQGASVIGAMLVHEMWNAAC
ncbi:uncharacterized protein CTRU02_204331 [Colletotrichum truncatum]|uniref:Uncharacterized protein n=1 Tax=Colletotrichum truncatum TaxID=5467 RepID=A0ACC3ZCC9_COLTU|nr:uncharacterized protein CTRU02_13051 [Colletotrichum truncatum]KAF6783801.1 hypothetical protein CTRU02_13051 [Colletotrichum truncatum]